MNRKDKFSLILNSEFPQPVQSYRLQLIELLIDELEFEHPEY